MWKLDVILAVKNGSRPWIVMCDGEVGVVQFGVVQFQLDLDEFDSRQMSTAALIYS